MTILRHFFIILLTLICINSYAMSSGGRQILLSQSYHAIPLHRASNPNVFIVDVRIGGKGYSFLLDTGSSATTLTLTQNQINSAGLQVQKNNSVYEKGSGGVYVQRFKAVIPEFRLNGFTSHNEIAYISTFSGRSGAHFAGIIGSDFLRRHAALIDISNHTLYLKSGNSTGLSAAAFIQNGYQAVHLNRTGSGHQVLTVMINNIPARFLFDSGASNTLISMSFAKQHGISILARVGNASGATGGNFGVYRISTPKLSIGNVSYATPQIYATNLDYVSAGNVSVVGTLGMDWMEANDAIIDMRADRVFIK